VSALKILTASYSGLKAHKNLIDIREKKKTPPEAQDDDCRSPPTKILKAKEMKEAFDHLEQVLSIMEECDMNTERSSQVCRAIARDTACYRLPYQEKKKASVQLSVDHFFKKDEKMPSASTCSWH
jgi:hypothetical protein